MRAMRARGLLKIEDLKVHLQYQWSSHNTINGDITTRNSYFGKSLSMLCKNFDNIPILQTSVL